MTEKEWLNCADPERMRTFLKADPSDRKLRLLACGCSRRLLHLLPDGALKEGVEVAERYTDGACSTEEFRQAAVQAAVLLASLNRLGTRAAQATTNWGPGGWEPAHAIWHGKDDDVNDEAFRDLVDAAPEPEIDRTISSSPAMRILAVTDACTVAFLAAFRDLREYPGAGAWMFARSAATFAAVPVGDEETQMPCDPSDPAEAAAQAALIRDVCGNPFRAVSIKTAWVTPPVKELAATIYDAKAFDRLPFLADALEDAGCSSQDILSHFRGPGKHVRGCWALDLVLGKE